MVCVRACGRRRTPIGEAGQAEVVNRVRSAVGVLVLVLAVSGVTAVLLTARRSPARTPTPAPAAATALAVLHDWDIRRADAYAEGSAERLRDLYVPGSAAGAADVRLLERYRSRGLRITGLRMQVLGLAVTVRTADRWTVRVTDRLAGGAAVRASGRASRPTSKPASQLASAAASQRLPLPRDAVTARVLTLLRGGDSRWRMSAVTDPATPARPAAGR
jgi:hypothetical protein